MSSGSERHEDPVALLSAETLRAILSSARDAIITLNSEHRIILFNQGAEAMFRCAAQDAIGTRIDRFIPEEFRERHDDHIRRFGAGDVPLRSMGQQRVLSGLRANGERFPIEAQISYAIAGTELLYTVVVRDITERTRAEAERDELLQRETQARQRAEAATQLVARVQSIADAALGGLSTDDLLEALLTRSRAVLATDTAVILLRDDDELRVRCALGLEEDVQRQVRVPIGAGFAGRVAAERRPIVLDDVESVNPVSGYFRQKGIQSVAGVPLEVGGRVIGVLHVGSKSPRHFNTDDMQVLQLAAERIAVAVQRAAAHDAERIAREAAERANRAKDEFLSTISHELRTPLAAILGWVRVLRQGKHSPERFERALRTIERSGRSQAKLVEDLLDLSRMINNRLRLELGIVDLRTILEAAVEALRPTADEKGIELVLDTDPQPSIVRGDAERLQQIVSNLMNNAVKFTPTGGRVTLTLACHSDRATISISDTGKGVPPEFVPKLFEPFEQAESVRNRFTGGLGLGLSIVRHLAELHGGEVRASSPGEGLGSTFTVSLPLLNPEEIALDARSERRRLDDVRVLVVEDDPEVRETMRLILEQAGAIVATAATAEEARLALGNAYPDVLVADIRLPGADAYTLLREIRENRHTERLPAIAITAYAEEDDARVLAAGFQRRFMKPFESDDLVASIATLAQTTEAWN